jgi:SAM-dependent methyltransferase
MSHDAAASPERSAGWRNADAHADNASRYLELLTRVLQTQKTRSIELLNLAPGHSAIEIGCGLGRECEAMARIVGAAGRVVGIDASQALLDQAIARTAPLGLPLEFRVGDAHALPFPDSSFDAARGERVFEHLADPAQAVRELARVVRPGGRIAGIEPDWETIVVGGVKLAVTRAVVRHKVDVAIAHGAIGREMGRQLFEAGCGDVVCEMGVVTFGTLALAEQVLSLRANLDAARALGWIGAADADAWWADLVRLDRAGVFLASLCGSIFSATVR